MDLLLSRTMAPTDLSAFTPEREHLALGTDGSLSAERRWEYCLALHAMRRRAAASEAHEAREDVVYVLGGPELLVEIVEAWAPAAHVLPLDPLGDLVEGCRGGTPLADTVVCLSLIDRVGNLDHFLYLLSALVAPGGLVVLTMAYWNRCGADTAAHHQLRARIFCPKTYGALRAKLATLALTPWGGYDPSWHGPQIHDYTLASLVLEKRP